MAQGTGVQRPLAHFGGSVDAATLPTRQPLQYNPSTSVRGKEHGQPSHNHHKDHGHRVTASRARQPAVAYILVIAASYSRVESQLGQIGLVNVLFSRLITELFHHVDDRLAADLQCDTRGAVRIRHALRWHAEMVLQLFASDFASIQARLDLDLLAEVSSGSRAHPVGEYLAFSFALGR